MQKRILSWILAVCLVCSMLPMGVSAADVVANGTCGENLVWRLDEDGVLTVSGSGDMDNYTNGGPWSPYHNEITKIIIENGVTSIGEAAFYGQVGTGRFDENYMYLTDIQIADTVTVLKKRAFNDNPGIESICIPGSVKEIGSAAFQDCYFLSDVVLEDGIEIIGDYAFDVCAMPTIDIPDSVISIGVQAFSNNDFLGEVVIPEGVESVGLWAFAACPQLTKVTLPASVAELGGGLFHLCPELNSILLDSENRNYALENGVLYSKDQTLLHTVPRNWSGSFVIPETVTTIAECAFENCAGIQKVNIPSSVSTIERYAFAECDGLTDIYYSGSEEQWEEIEVAYSNTPLSNAQIHYNVVYVGDEVSGTCGENLIWSLDADGVLTISGTGAMDSYYDERAPWDAYRNDIVHLVVEEGVTTIGDWAFLSCTNLVDVVLPDSLLEICFGAFDCCEALASITIPENVRSIGAQAFVDCNSLTEIEIPGSVTSIGRIAFSCINLSKVTFHEGLVTIGDEVFFGAPISEIVLPTTLREIGYRAFGDCKLISEVSIPEGVTTVGKQAFWNCNALTDVSISSTVTDLGYGAFGLCPNLETIRLDERNPAYILRDKVIFTADGTMLHTAAGAKAGAYAIPDTVTAIADYAFTDCEQLTEILIPNSIQSVGIWAFNGCSALTEATVPDSLETIPYRMFACCDNLKTVTLPETITSIGGEAFAFCDNLARVNIPDTVSEIGQSAFRECTSLLQVHIPEGVTTIDSWAFACCESLTSVTIPTTVTSVINAAFRNCEALETIIFLGNAPKFDTNVFYEVTASAYYPAGNSTWTSSKKQNYGGSITWIAGHPCDQGHKWNAGEMTAEPTCTESGSVTYTCDCGATYTETIPALGHDFRNGYCTVCQASQLTVPTIISCYSKQQTSVKVTWTVSDGADGYELWRTTMPNDDTSWIKAKTIYGAGIDRYTNQGLEIGTTYYYKVRAYIQNSDGSRIYSDFSNVDYMPAAVVFGNVYGKSTEVIRLNWNLVGGAHGYQIWRMDDNGNWAIAKTIGDRGNVLIVDQGGVTAYSNTGLVAGNAYTYKMRAFMITEDGRKIFGAYSDVFTVTTTPDVPVISVRSPKATRAQISWEPVSGAAGYQIWMADEDGTYKIVKTLVGDTISYTKYDLTSGQTYSFKVRAFTDVNGKMTFGNYSLVADVTVK